MGILVLSRAQYRRHVLKNEVSSASEGLGGRYSVLETECIAPRRLVHVIDPPYRVLPVRRVSFWRSVSEIINSILR